MVKEKVVGNVNYFKCSACGFFYKEKELAQRCEDFCRAHKSCSLEITRNAVKVK